MYTSSVGDALMSSLKEPRIDTRAGNRSLLGATAKGARTRIAVPGIERWSNEYYVGDLDFSCMIGWAFASALFICCTWSSWQM
jgi:hypothetical protein